MKRYYVGIREIHVSTRLVEAASPDEALEKATSVDDEVYCEYSHTMDREHWTVEEIPEKP